MKYLLLVSIFFVLASCGEKAAAPAAFNLEAFELTDIPGSDLKRAVFKNEKGKILENGTIRNGKRHGAWVVYQKDRDMPKSVASYVDGVLNGPYLEFTPYGYTELSCNYSNDLLEGYFVKFKNNRKMEEGYYLKGKLDGIYKKYYDGQEVIQQELTYKQDVLEGDNIYYNDKGEVTMRYTYKNGEKVSGGIVSASK